MSSATADYPRLKSALEQARAQGDRDADTQARDELERLAASAEEEARQARLALDDVRRRRATLAAERERLGAEVARRRARPPVRPEVAALAGLLREFDPDGFRRLLGREAELLERGPDPGEWAALLEDAAGLLDGLGGLSSWPASWAALPLGEAAYRAELEAVLTLDERLRAAVAARIAEEGHEPRG
jgi:hypothetical protein